MKNLIKSILFLLFFQSCITDVELHLPLQHSIVLNGLIVPKKTIEINLYRSKNGIDTVGFESIDDATVSLYINGEKAENLVFMGNGTYNSLFAAQELTNYKVIVETNQGEKAWAETTVPVNDFGAYIQSNNEIDSTNRFNWPFYITLIDDSLYQNYYWVCDLQFEFTPDSITRRTLSSSLKSNSPYIDSFNMTYDPSTASEYKYDYSNYIFIPDVMFSGERIQIDLLPMKYSTLKQDSFIVYNMDVHYSNYLKSKLINDEGSLFISNNGPPINYKPAFLYSNVHGGMGILGSYTVYSKGYRY